MKHSMVWSLAAGLATLAGTAALFFSAEPKREGGEGAAEVTGRAADAVNPQLPPPLEQGPPPSAQGVVSKLQGQWQHLDTRFKYSCTGSPEKEKEAKGESFTISEGRSPGEVQYSDRSCSLRLGVVGTQARVLPDQSCGAEKAFHYQVLTVTLSGEDVARLEGRGVFRIDTQEKLVECSFHTTGTAKRLPG